MSRFKHLQEHDHRLFGGCHRDLSRGHHTQHFCLLVSLQLIIFLSHPLISLIGRLREDKGLHSNKGLLSCFYCFVVFILTSPYFREIFWEEFLSHLQKAILVMELWQRARTLSNLNFLFTTGVVSSRPNCCEIR